MAIYIPGASGGGGELIPSNIPMKAGAGLTGIPERMNQCNVSANVGAGGSLATLIDITEPLIIHDLFVKTTGTGTWKTGLFEVYINEQKVFDQTSFYIEYYQIVFNSQSVPCDRLRVMAQGQVAGWNIWAHARISMQ
ncbi:hypothetical protein [Pseudoteredinibacter isoporae]|uniref:hypothetical protein n=1 Tax=Pseudoteredinibacter isoporae TaxID=570281 RepID=UPI003106D2F0